MTVVDDCLIRLIDGMDPIVEPQFESLRREILLCKKCALAKTRGNAVPGEGCLDARVMFVGEAPGRQEDLEGRPFVGRAGKLLDSLLATVSLRRETVFIGNVLKCRPTSDMGRDRRPTELEISACSPFLERQIALIKPRVICALGDTATSFLLQNYGFESGRIGRIHGRMYHARSLTIVPSYHPAAALYTYPLRNAMEEDFRKVVELLRQATMEGFQ